MAVQHGLRTSFYELWIPIAHSPYRNLEAGSLLCCKCGVGATRYLGMDLDEGAERRFFCPNCVEDCPIALEYAKAYTLRRVSTYSSQEISGVGPTVKISQKYDPNNFGQPLQ